jgi:Predicted dehydrogenases and related proteins
MGRWHANAARRAGAQVAIVVDPDETSGRALSDRIPGAVWASDMTGLHQSGVTSVHVCSPPERHAADVNAALAAGAHCLVEKPLASSADDTRALLAAADRAKLLLCPSHQFLFQRGTQYALGRAVSIAPVRHAVAICCTAGARAAERATDLAMNILPHPLSVFRRIAGDQFRELSWNALVTGEGEVTAVSEGGEASFVIIISCQGRPTRNEIEIIGGRGSLYLDLFHGFATEERPILSRSAKITRPLAVSVRRLASAVGGLSQRAIARETAFPGLLELTRQYYQAIKGGTAAPITSSETLDVAIARDLIIQASRKSPLA